MKKTTTAEMQAGRGRQIRDMTKIALMTAVMCILGPLSVQIGPVPLSFTNLAVFFSIYLLGTKRGTISYIIYMLLGIVGLPVFSGFQGGFGKLFGNTGGYIIGFIFMAVICGIFIDTWPKKKILHFVGMALGMAVCYLFGTVWYAGLAKCPFQSALAVCVLPFLPGDLIKMTAALIAGPRIRSHLIKANII